VTATYEDRTSVTGGFDIGARSVAMAILSHDNGGPSVLAQASFPLPASRDVHDSWVAIREHWRQLLVTADVSAGDVDNMASTGTGATDLLRIGHLHDRSIHGLGARFLFPDATAALEIEENQLNFTLLNEPGTPAGEARRWAGASLPEYLETRAAMLLGSLATRGKVVLTGEMVFNTRCVQRLWSRLLALQSNVSLLISADGRFAAAYGAAILAARRFTAISQPAGPAFTDLSTKTFLEHSQRSLN
jgi:activator of 2-hydroxyglutaryl-CoA dehydratase